MSRTNDVQKEVAAAKGDVPLCVETPYRKHMFREAGETIPHVVHDLTIWLSLKGDGAHYRDARSWAHVKMSKTPNAPFWFFQYLLLLGEKARLGSARPHADLVGDPQTYARTVELTARKHRNAISLEERKELEVLLKADQFVDLRFLHDVANKKRELDANPAAVGRGRGRGRGRGADPAAAPGGAPAAAAPAAPAPAADAAGPEDARITAALQAAREFSLRLTRTLDEEDEILGLENEDPAWDYAYELGHQGGGPQGVGPQGPQGGPMADGPEFMQKVTMCVVPARSLEGTVVGLLVRFLIHDPDLNPMLFLRQLVDNAIARSEFNAKPAGSAKAGARPSFAKELFPEYAGYFATSTHPTASSTRYETYFQCALDMRPELLETHTREYLQSALLRSATSLSSEMHIGRILTMQRALDAAVDAGADPAFFGRLADWVSPGQGNVKVAHFPCSYYAYRPNALFWTSAVNLGLKEQMFPHIDTDNDFVTALLAGRSIDTFLDVQGDDADALTLEEREKKREQDEKDLRSEFDEVRVLLQNNVVVERRLLLASKLVPYDTPNTYVHRAAEAERLNAVLDKQRPPHHAQTMQDVQDVAHHFGAKLWRHTLHAKPQDVEEWMLGNDKSKSPADAKRSRLARRNLSLAQRVEECERFIKILDMAQMARLKVFAALWPVEGDVDDVPVPSSIRCILRWFRDIRANPDAAHHLTREFHMFDPELGIFGNSMLRQIKMYSCVGLILQPLICMLTEGLFSCYRWSPKKLAFNLLLHGRFDTGKTYTAITMLQKLTTIPGTVLIYVARSKAADTTMRHYYDLIVASDEVQQHKVSQAEAERNPEMTNKDKVKMTERSVAVEIFTYELDSDGNQQRWTRTFHTDHYVALVEVTNYVVEAQAALSSRYHRLTVAQPQLEARKLQNDDFMSALLKGDVRGYLNTNQYLSACVYKAIQVGAMFEPNMALFLDLCNRIIDYLQTKHAISRDVGARGIEIMTPYAIQLVIHNAIHCAFDLPGAPNYRKDFTAEMIRAVQPYLYCTVDIVWWCWTSLASGWIEENNSNVIEGALHKCGIREWGSSADGITPYEMFELDIHDKIPWRRRPNEANPKDPLIDLQYITLHGSKEQVARQIAMHTTSPRISASDVLSVFNVLAEMAVPVPWNGYRPMPLSLMKKWHQFKVLPTLDPKGHKVIGEDGVERIMRDKLPGVKMVPRGGEEFPAEFCLENKHQDVQRTVRDMPRIGPDQKMLVIDLCDSGKNMIHIMPWVAEYFRSSKVIEALHYATVCQSTRIGKILTGMHVQGDQRNFMVERFTKESVDASCAQFDMKEGWSADGRTWLGTDNLPANLTPSKRPVSRRVGIAFDRQGALGKTDAMIFSVPAAPTNMSFDEWRSRSEADTNQMQDVLKVVPDLDYESARQQHIRCGRPLDEPVRSPAWIEEQYKRECAALGRPWHSDMDYPNDALLDAQDMREHWVTTERVRAASDVMPMINKIRQQANQPRKAKRTEPEPSEPLEPQAPQPAAAPARSIRPKAGPRNLGAELAQRRMLQEVENRE